VKWKDLNIKYIYSKSMVRRVVPRPERATPVRAQTGCQSLGFLESGFGLVASRLREVVAEPMVVQAA
jgi:hypothetical protein